MTGPFVLAGAESQTLVDVCLALQAGEANGTGALEGSRGTLTARATVLTGIHRAFVDICKWKTIVS